MAALGRRVLVLVLHQVLEHLPWILIAIDDSPTKRFGPKVQGAGIHHDPTPGPAGSAFCYGHVWVTLAIVIRHPWWGTIALPIWSWLYVRKQDIAKIPAKYGWTFQTKLQLAADLVLMAAQTLQFQAKKMLYDLPPQKTTRRGRKRKYGKHRMSLAKRAAQPRGDSDVPCTVYGHETVNRVKTFLATHRTFGS